MTEKENVPYLTVHPYARSSLMMGSRVRRTSSCGNLLKSGQGKQKVIRPLCTRQNPSPSLPLLLPSLSSLHYPML
eukprot:747107-Hanusia_phi.AAC.12